MGRAKASPAGFFALFPAAAIVTLTVVLPVVVLTAENIRFADLSEVWARPGVAQAVWFSTWQAAVSTILTVVLGLVPTWILSRYKFRGRTLVHLLLTAPFVLPTVVVGAAFLALFPDALDRSVGAIVAAHVFFNIALVIRTVGPAWSLLEDDLIRAARTLGATPIQIWRHVLLPLAGPALRSSAALVFLMCFTSFGVVRILGGPTRATVDVEIYRRVVQLGDTSGATVLALTQTILIALAATIWMRRPTLALHTAQSPSHSQQSSAPRLLLGVAYLSAAIMTIPIIALVISSLRTNDGLSLRSYKVLFGLETVDRLPVEITGVVTTSILFAFLTVIIAVPSGVLAAQALTRRSGREHSGKMLPFSSALFVLPLGTSAVVVGFGILVTYDQDPYDIRSAWWLIPIVHAAIALPFVIRSAIPVLQSVPPDLREAASSLGASPTQRFFSIDLPLIRPAITSAIALSGALSLGEFGATSFLTRRDTETLPIAISRLLSRAGSLSFSTAMAAATLLLVLTMAVISLADSGSRR